MPSGFRFVSRRPSDILRDGEVMRAPYGLEIIGSPVHIAGIGFSVISLHLRWNRCPRLLLLPSTRKGRRCLWKGNRHAGFSCYAAAE